MYPPRPATNSLVMGRYLNNVRKIFGFLTPPLVCKFMQPPFLGFLTTYVCFWGTPSPKCGRHISSIPPKYSVSPDDPFHSCFPSHRVCFPFIKEQLASSFLIRFLFGRPCARVREPSASRDKVYLLHLETSSDDITPQGRNPW